MLIFTVYQVTDGKFLLVLNVSLFLCRTKEWDQISEGEKQRLQLITKDDGEFW